MEELTIECFAKICRFCLTSSNELQIISDVPSADLFWSITGTKITDGFEYVLPQTICSSCVCRFQEFSNFLETSKININKLKAIYQQHTVQKDELDISDNEVLDYDCKKFGETENYKQISSNKNNNSESKGIQTKCETCGKKFKTEKLFAKHTRTGKCIYKESKKRKTIPNNYFICKRCKLIFKSRTDLAIHRKKDLTCQPIDFKCPECNKEFRKQHMLKNHMRSHTKEAPFKCTECEKTFRFQQNLKRHILIHQGVKKFKCEDCGKAFSRAHVLNEHKNIHTGHNPYICDYCGRGFKRYANHFIHVHRHRLLNGEIKQTEDKKLYLQLQCSVCNKIFASRGSLENHLILHQDQPREKKFLCNECGKGFITNCQLNSHMRMHTGDRPFECSQCDKKFTQKSAYNTHQLVHSGEKPYQCKQCDRLFTQSGHLKVHMRVHSGEKPFACNFCGRKFALRSNLKVHTRTHTGEKPYICSVCDKGFYDSTTLKKHKKSHGVGLPSHGHINSKIEPLALMYVVSHTENSDKEVLSEHTTGSK